MRLIDADALKKDISGAKKLGIEAVAYYIDQQPTAVVRCGECKYWDKQDDSPYGYCRACKHGHYSEHWEIGIYRRYKADWFCADGEREAQE